MRMQSKPNKKSKIQREIKKQILENEEIAKKISRMKKNLENANSKYNLLKNKVQAMLKNYCTEDYLKKINLEKLNYLGFVGILTRGGKTSLNVTDYNIASKFIEAREEFEKIQKQVKELQQQLYKNHQN